MLNTWQLWSSDREPCSHYRATERALVWLSANIWKTKERQSWGLHKWWKSVFPGVMGITCGKLALLPKLQISFKMCAHVRYMFENANLWYKELFLDLTIQIIQPTRCYNLQVYYLTFMCGSTCFGRFSAHHQEHKTALGATGFIVGEKQLKRCWSWSARPRPTTPQPLLSNGKTRGS
jgi:hypothetical protein